MHRLDGVHSTYAYGDVPHPLRMYYGKDFVEKFIEHTEYEIKHFYAPFPQQTLTEPLAWYVKKEAQSHWKI